MRLKLLNLLSASVTTLGVLAGDASTFGYGTEAQINITQMMLLEGSRENIRENDTQRTQEQQTVESIQSFSVAIYPRTTESSQPNSTRQIDWSAVFIDVIPITFVVVGIILIDLWYRKYKKQHHKRSAEIEQIFLDRKKQIEILERIWRIKS